MTQFHTEISTRIAQVRTEVREARAAGDDYLLEVRLGELESLARVAAEHGVQVEGVEDSLAEFGLTTPSLGVPLLVDLTEQQRRAAS